MSVYLSRRFWLDLGERAVKTVAQAALGAVGTAQLLDELDWQMVVSIAVLSGLVSVLSSIASAKARKP